MSRAVKLSEIADVTLGQTFRGKAEASDDASGIRLVQIKDIREGVISSLSPLSYANFDVAKLKVRIKKNDLLLPLRGNRYEAAIFNPKESSELVTTTNQVAIIRPKTPEVRLDFLLWYFNSKVGRTALNSINSGTTIPSINRSQLDSLTILLPKIQTQDEIIKVYMNWAKQKQVLREMIENGERLAGRVCIKLIDEIGHIE